MEASSRVFGRIATTGANVEAVTMKNASGMSVQVTNYGATILSVKVPGSVGITEEMTLCHTDLPSLQTVSPYFGTTVRRVANLIAKGEYKVDGKLYIGVIKLTTERTMLHGGTIGFDKVIGSPRVYVTPPAEGVEFSYTSPDGEEGHPGTLSVNADYRLTAENELI